MPPIHSDPPPSPARGANGLPTFNRGDALTAESLQRMSDGIGHSLDQLAATGANVGRLRAQLNQLLGQLGTVLGNHEGRIQRLEATGGQVVRFLDNTAKPNLPRGVR